jgi:hypothetical protein
MQNPEALAILQKGEEKRLLAQSPDSKTCRNAIMYRAKVPVPDALEILHPWQIISDAADVGRLSVRNYSQNCPQSMHCMGPRCGD